MAEGGENLTGVDQEAGAKPKKGRGRGLSKTNTSLVEPGIKQPGYKVISNQEYDDLMALKASTPIIGNAGPFNFPDLNASLLQSNFDVTPKLPIFSGSLEPNKSEVSYDVWSFEVKCLQNSHAIPEALLLQTIRNSLRGEARSMLVSLGESTTVDKVLAKLEGFYGLVSSSETLMQGFYNDCQKDTESIVQCGSRLESTLCKAIKQGHISDAAKESILCSKFWTGLKSKPLRSATRYLFDSVKDFQSLLKEIRKIEQEELCSSKASEKSTAHQNLGTARVEKESTTNEELLKTLQSIEKRLEKVELMHNQSNELSPPNTQFYGRGRAFRRGHSYNRGNNRGRYFKKPFEDKIRSDPKE